MSRFHSTSVLLPLENKARYWHYSIRLLACMICLFAWASESVGAPLAKPFTTVEGSDGADLTLDISVNNLRPHTGETVLCSITVHNQGPEPATNFAVSASIPNGLIDIDQISEGGVFQNSSLHWTEMSLQAGDSAIMTFMATVAAPSATSNYICIAEIESSAQDDPDSTPGNSIKAREDDDDDFILAPICKLSAGADMAAQVCNAGPSISTIDLNSYLHDNEITGFWSPMDGNQILASDPSQTDDMDMSSTTPTMIDFTGYRPGAYQYSFIVASDGTCTGDTTSLTINIESCFDLAVDAELVPQEIIDAGDTVTLQAMVQNQGSVDAYNIELGFYLHEDLSPIDGNHMKNIDHIPAGEEAMTQMRVKIADDHYFGDMSFSTEILQATLGQQESLNALDADRNSPTTDNIVAVSFAMQNGVDCSSNFSCHGGVNVAVENDCSLSLTQQTFSREANIVCVDSVWLEREDGSGFGSAFPAQFGENFPIDKYQYELYMDGNMVCWGSLNVENKNVPIGLSSRDTILCIDNRVDGPDEESIQAMLDTLCLPEQLSPVTSRSVNLSRDVCDTTIRVTTYSARFDLERPQLFDIWRDTLVILPLDTSMIKCPLPEVEVGCEFGNSPDSVAAYHDKRLKAELGISDELGSKINLGIPYAFPHICTDTADLITTRDSTYTIEEEVLIRVKREINGREVWVNLRTIQKRDTTVIVERDTIQVPTYVPIEKGNTCNISSQFVDSGYGNCVDSENGRVLRTWTLLDFCNKSQKECVQWVKMKDTIPPRFIDDNGQDISQLETQVASIAPWSCVPRHKVITPDIIDNCAENISYEYLVDEGSVNDEGYITSGWPDADSIRVMIIATDQCRNKDSVFYYVTAEDKVNPIAITVDKIKIRLTANFGEIDSLSNVTKIFVKDVDEGSHDSGCGGVTNCIIRPEDEEGEKVYNVEGEYLGRSPVTCGACTETLPLGEEVKADGQVSYVYYDEEGHPINPVEIVRCCDYVSFCCVDRGEEPLKMYVEDASGNRAVGWTIVEIDDQVGLQVQCEDIQIDCAEDMEFTAKQSPTVIDACGKVLMSEYEDSGDIAECAGGTITRTWYYQGEAICQQLITMSSQGGFDPYTIKWPKHYNNTSYEGVRRECEEIEDGEHGIVEYEANIDMGEGLKCTASTVSTTPVWCASPCGQIFHSYEDEEIAADDACKQVIRRHLVIDWCTYSPNGSTPDDNNDTDYDRFEAIDDEWLVEAGMQVSATTQAGEACENCANASGDADAVFFRYTQVRIDGYYTFDQIISVSDDLAPVIDAPEEITLQVGTSASKGEFEYNSSLTCSASEPVIARAIDSCGGMALDASTTRWTIELRSFDENGVQDTSQRRTLSMQGDSISVMAPQGIPGWRGEIIWTATDGCGNTTRDRTIVRYTDSIAPTPVCIQSISTATMQSDSSTIEIWASDFDNGSFDNCGEVTLMIREPGGELAPSLTFTCDDLINGLLRVFELELHAIDAAGNSEFCNVTMRVDDNADVCPNNNDILGQTAIIAGAVRTELGDMVEDAEVTIENYNAMSTPLDGEFAFPHNSLNQDYKLYSQKDGDDLNGVTALDMVMIQRHILGMRLLDSPYKVIAADVNNDARVNVSDLAALRRLLLGHYSEFPDNDSWRFVDAQQTFAESWNPFPFREVLEIKLDNSNAGLDKDFIGIKIGDVSADAAANSSHLADSRALDIMPLTFTQVKTLANGATEWAVSTDEVLDLEAYQFSIAGAHFEQAIIRSGKLKISPEDYRLTSRGLNMVWASAEPIATDAPLFYIQLPADIDASEWVEGLSIDNPTIESRLYAQGNTYKLAVQNTENKYEVAASDFELKQNVPNPFRHTTTIGFQLPESNDVNLHFFDQTGAMIHVHKGYYTKGYHEVVLSRDDLEVDGIIYYQLESGQYVATKKMIVID